MATTPSPARPGAGPWIPSEPSLDDLRSAATHCEGCELYADATQVVMGRGRPEAPLLVLGEQPGDQEDRQGQPFVGPAGGLLVKALTEAGIDPADVYRTNAVKHFRWKASGKRRIHQSPTQAHVSACAPWLVAELALVRPRGIVLLGATAGKAVYGTGFRVGETRGTFMDWPVETLPTAGDTPWVLPTIHPSAVLRADDYQPAYDGLVADLRLATARLAT